MSRRGRPPKVPVDLDVEANEFACRLLVPDALLRQVLEKRGGIEWTDDQGLRDLARVFQVPLLVMSKRILDLYREREVRDATAR